MFRKFLTVQNCTYAVIVSVIAAFCVWGYLRDRPSPSPVDIKIVGPNTASVGGITVLAVDGTGVTSYAWVAIPGSCKYRAMEGGRVLVLVFHAPGEYTIILGTNNGSKVELRKHVVSAKGPDPGPGPPPPVPPEPEPEPEPYDSAWVKWTYEVAISTVTSSDRASQAALLAKQFENISAQIASGSIVTTKEARIKLRVANNLALGNDAIAWAAFSKKFSDYCIELEATGGLKLLMQYQIIYNSTAKGLMEVASKKKVESRALSCTSGSCK